MSLMHLTARFFRPTDARCFAYELEKPEWFAEGIKHRHNSTLVEWQCDPYAVDPVEQAEHHYFDRLVHTVGYWGSTQQRMATLLATVAQPEGREPLEWSRKCPAVR